MRDSEKTDLQELKALYAKIRSRISEKRETAIVYPSEKEVMNSLRHFDSLSEVRCVILGQDPYHGPNQAHGLAFSVQSGVDVPPSLKNIFKELKADLGMKIPNHGDLTAWARQGVLLLNKVLTVEEGKARSHAGLGWEELTDKVITLVNKHSTNCVFILWGSDAQRVEPLIDSSKHLILKAAHPSPLSASRGFFGCKHFSKANAYLTQCGREPINWNSINEAQS